VNERNASETTTQVLLELERRVGLLLYLFDPKYLSINEFTTFELGHFLELATSLGPLERVRRHPLLEKSDLVRIPTPCDPLAVLLEQYGLNDYSPAGLGLVGATLGQELLESDGAAGTFLRALVTGPP
jgi:hypothetical protein